MTEQSEDRMSSAVPYTLAVMITTYNRAGDLSRTLQVIAAMQPGPDEILITADGCSDETVAKVRELLPRARLFVNGNRIGSVANRDRMLRAATTDLVLSLDDDSYPEQPDCILRLKDLFMAAPRLAVAHFPQHTDEYPETLNRVDFGEARQTGSFANSGACYRRSAYLSLPGFVHRFFHSYEEPDYALQCVASGYLVVYWPEISIRHHYSRVSRNEINTHHRHARNEFLSALIRCPMPVLLLVVPFRILSQLRYACSRGVDWVIREPLWWWSAIKCMGSVLRARRPVNIRSYSRWLKLLRRPVPLSLAE